MTLLVGGQTVFFSAETRAVGITYVEIGIPVHQNTDACSVLFHGLIEVTLAALQNPLRQYSGSLPLPSV
jgi:hypothetical protein